MAHQVTLQGNAVTLAGNFPTVGQKAADFSLVGKDLNDVSLAQLPANVKY